MRNLKVYTTSTPNCFPFHSTASLSTRTCSGVNKLNYSFAEYSVENFMKIKFLNKAVDAINLPAILRSTSVTDKFQSSLEIKSHELCHLNILALLPESRLTLRQLFQSNVIVSDYLYHHLVSVKNLSFSMQLMAMLSLEIQGSWKMPN